MSISEGGDLIHLDGHLTQSERNPKVRSVVIAVPAHFAIAPWGWRQQQSSDIRSKRDRSKRDRPHLD